MPPLTKKSTFGLCMAGLLTALIGVIGYGGTFLKSDLAASTTFTPTDDVSVPADYDGDGTVDTAVWHGATSIWEITRSTDGQKVEKAWGAGYAPYYDLPVPGDYDGDDKADFAVWRRQNGTWYILRSSDGGYVGKAWGSAFAPYDDIPLPEDYDNDGKTDIAVHRPGDRKIYIIRSSDGGITSQDYVDSTPPPAGNGEKSSFHTFSNLRAGMRQVGNEWEVEDFAFHFANPSDRDIDVEWKIISDDPTLRFVDGQVGTWTKRLPLKPKGYQSLNIIGGEVRDFVIAPYTFFLGRSEVRGCVRGSSPCVPTEFYAYLLPQVPVTRGTDANLAWYEAWDVWSGQVPGPWDAELGAFVVPYTNYWHNVTEFPKGWYSRLTIVNESGSAITYSIKHIPDDYSGIASDPASCAFYPFPVEPGNDGQTASLTVAAGETRRVDLQTLFGWRTDVASYMEGQLVITPSDTSSASRTTVYSDTLPGTGGAPLCAPANTYVARLSLTSPAPGSSLSGTVNLKARVVASRGTDLTAVKFYVDGNEIGNGTVSSALGFDSVLQWDTTGTPNGPHRITAKAFRGTAPIGNEASLDVTTNNTSACATLCTSDFHCCAGQRCVIQPGKITGRCQ